MIVVAQNGKEYNAHEGELQITNDCEAIIFINRAEERKVLGRYKSFERRIAVFAEVYAAKNSGQGRFTMPAR